MGAPSPRASPVVTGQTVCPFGRSLLPACLVYSRSLCGDSGGSGLFIFIFWWIWVRVIMACARRERPPASGWLQYGWVGGDIKARVGLRCKVKLPRRGPSAAARGGRREQASGWRHLRCVHSSASPGGEGGGRSARTSLA